MFNRIVFSLCLARQQDVAFLPVSSNPSSSAHKFASKHDCHSGCGTRLLDRLDNKGMIQRATQERVDRTQDRRVIEIVLTERGINVMRELNPHWQSALSELTEAFKQSEIHGLALTD